MSVKRIYVEKKPEFAVKAKELREEIENYLGISAVTGVRVLIRYLIFGKKTAQSLKNKALCRSVYIGYTALFFKLKKFF